MPVQPLGEYARIVARREAAVARLSPAARARAFPTIYAQPLPAHSPFEDLRKENATLVAERDKLRKRIDELALTNESLTTELARLQLSGLAVYTAKEVSIPAIMLSFCRALDQAGYRLPAGELYTFDHLKGEQRGRPYAWPRQIAMWCCRRLAKTASWPIIAKHFGDRDHTTPMHACRRASFILGEVPELARASAIVLAEFERARS